MLYTSVPRVALMFCADNGHSCVAGLLLEHGADMNLRTKEGETALARAFMHGHSTEAAELLIVKGKKFTLTSS